MFGNVLACPEIAEFFDSTVMFLFGSGELIVARAPVASLLATIRPDAAWAVRQLPTRGPPYEAFVGVHQLRVALQRVDSSNWGLNGAGRRR